MPLWVELGGLSQGNRGSLGGLEWNSGWKVRPGILTSISCDPLSFTWPFLNQYNYMGSRCGVNLTDLSLYQALQEQLTSVVQEIGHLIDPIATAARGEAAQLGHKVTGIERGDSAESVREGGRGRGERILILLLLFLKGSWLVLEPSQCWPTLKKRPLNLPQPLLQKWLPQGSLFT